MSRAMVAAPIQWLLSALERAIGAPEIVWVAALVVALAYEVNSARKDDLNPRSAYWGGVFAIVLGAWGGSLLGFVYYGTDGRPWAWLRFWSGGRAEYGGLLAGMLAILIYIRIRRQPFLRYADAIAPGVALGVAIGRIGCFLNGDDFGTRTQFPWAVTFPPGTEAYADHVSRGWITPGAATSLTVHPVQLYASLLALGLFVALVLLRESPTGTRFAVFLGVHGLCRFFLEYWRGDFQPLFGSFSLTQLISSGFVLLGAGVLLSQQQSLHRAKNTAPSALRLSSEES